MIDPLESLDNYVYGDPDALLFQGEDNPEQREKDFLKLMQSLDRLNNDDLQVFLLDYADDDTLTIYDLVDMILYYRKIMRTPKVDKWIGVQE